MLAEYLEKWAQREERRSRAEWAAVLLKRIIESDQRGEFVDTQILSREEFDQIKNFLALLTGEKNQDEINFSLISECLSLDPKRLNELYLIVSAMREAPEPPPGYHWKLVKNKELLSD